MKHVITGGAGFIGHHLARYLVVEYGEKVACIDRDAAAIDEYSTTDWGRYVEWYSIDLSVYPLIEVLKPGDRIWALAADMGGMGYIGTGKNDVTLSTQNVLINAATVRDAQQRKADRVFYASSACVYNEMLQMEEDITPLREVDAIPAQPDTIYGWEKLYSEQMYSALNKAGIPTRIVRFHNVYGPEGAWRGGREKAPAALCRKIAQAKKAKKREIEIWGDGEQRRSFLYIDDAIEGIVSLMESDYSKPTNIGMDVDISINGLAWLISAIADWEVELVHVSGPEGVRGRNADVTVAYQELGWYPMIPLEEGLKKTYNWIEFQVFNEV